MELVPSPQFPEAVFDGNGDTAVAGMDVKSVRYHQVYFHLNPFGLAKIQTLLLQKKVSNSSFKWSL